MGFGIKTRIKKKLSEMVQTSKLNSFIRESIRKNQGQINSFNTNSSGDVLLLGNGPSAKDIDIERICRTGVISACVNFFPNNSDIFYSIKPRFLFLMDPRFFTDSRKNDEDIILEKKLAEVDWEMTIVIPAGYNYNINNEKIDCFHLNTNYYQDERSERIFKLYDENTISPGAMNVIIAAMYFLIASGYKRILFAGVDMSEFKDIYVDENNRIFVESTHFYGKRKFYPDEVGVGKYDIHEYLSFYLKMFYEFSIIAEYAKWKNTDIYNLSSNSYLDNFRKLSEDKAINLITGDKE